LTVKKKIKHMVFPQKKASKATRKEKKRAKRKRARLKKRPPVVMGVAHIYASFTNCIVTISDLYGNALCWSSSGKCKFKGRKKRSHVAGAEVGEDAGKAVVTRRRMKRVIAILKGVGRARVAIIKGLRRSGLFVLRIQDRTPVPFNGCRPRKRRRI
jgi:small subunit ribosomal protein S11